MGRVKRLGLGGMKFPPTPSLSQATTAIPAHSAFLQLLTSPPSNWERGKERKVAGLAQAGICIKTTCSRLAQGCFSHHNTEVLSRVINVSVDQTQFN